jgi:hypothetical protein
MAKMKTYASFDSYLADQSPKNAKAIRKLRRFVRQVAPSLIESVKWGNGVWLGTIGPVAYVFSATDHVQFGFFMGSKLKDPKDLLRGSGKFVRHVKISMPSDLDELALEPFLKQAVRARYGSY